MRTTIELLPLNICVNYDSSTNTYHISLEDNNYQITMPLKNMVKMEATHTQVNCLNGWTDLSSIDDTTMFFPHIIVNIVNIVQEAIKWQEYWVN